MRVLLDECLPRRLRKHLHGHEVRTVPEVGWAGKKNGELLNLAAGAFEVLLTIDQRLPSHHGEGEASHLAVITLQARSNRLGDLLPLVPRILDALENVEFGQIQRIG